MKSSVSCTAKRYRWFNLILKKKKKDMERIGSKAYSMSERIYVFQILFPILISCYQLFSKYVY